MKWTNGLILCIISLCFAKSPKKIIGGRPAEENEFCYAVSLQLFDTHICGGSIVSPNFVLSAANCVVIFKHVFVGNLKVKIGTNDLLDTSNSITMEITHIIFHEDFNPQSFWGDDIALLKLERPVIFSINICGMSMPTGYVRTRQRFETAGWGQSSNNNFDYAPTRYLHTTSLFNKIPEECMELYKGFVPTILNFFSRDYGCAVTKSKHQAVTLGDGGSGVVMNERIAGIVSLYKTGTNSIVFTKVFRHREWIWNMVAKFYAIFPKRIPV